MFLKPPIKTTELVEILATKDLRVPNTIAHPAPSQEEFDQITDKVERYFEEKALELQAKKKKSKGKDKATASSSKDQPTQSIPSLYGPLADQYISPYELTQGYRKSLNDFFRDYQPQNQEEKTPFDDTIPVVDTTEVFGDTQDYFPADIDLLFGQNDKEIESEETPEQVQENNIADIDNPIYNPWNPQAEVPQFQLDRPLTPPQAPLVPPVLPPAVPPVAPPVPPPPVQPPQPQPEEDEMTHASYPTFDGTNPRKWIAELEIAFIANNIPGDGHLRKIGIAALNLGPAKMWYVTLANKPVIWDAAQGQDGFKEIFLAKYATEGNRAQASQQAYTRMQRKTESVNDYLNALQEMWLECGNNANIPEWMKVSQFVNGLLPALRVPVLQQAPADMAQAVQLATNCFYAMRAAVQPSHGAEVNDTLLEKITLLEVQLAELRSPSANNNNNNGGFQPGNSNPRRNGVRCHYCGNNGHMHRECRIKSSHIRQGRKLNWAVPRQNNQGQGKGQPRQ